MGWFNKEEKVPEIPAAPRLPDLPSVAKTESLPTLPAKLGEGLNRDLVKSAVHDDDSYGEVEVSMDELPRDFHFKESIASEHGIPPVPVQNEMKDLRKVAGIKKVEMKNEPVFVRIDKFQAAKADLAIVQKDVKDIELLMGKFKDTKDKEDKEISELEKEMDEIKSRLGHVESEVFGKI